MLKKITIIIFAVAHAILLSSQTLSDSARISLLTCTPGKYVYSQYGHSALRVVDPMHKLDITFNYGIFSFDTEDFYLKFVRGETDYQLGIDDTQSFLWSSAYIGRTTYEQPLNLSASQRQAIFDALVENYRPENRFYRYNFVFDNCATRPYVLLRQALDLPSADMRDAMYGVSTPEANIERERRNSITSLRGKGSEGDAINGVSTPYAGSAPYAGSELSIIESNQETYRELISHYSQANAWVDFGVNLIFGKDADKEMRPEERLFLPEELMRYIANTKLADGTPLTYAKEVEPFIINHTPWYISPYMLVTLLCLLLIALTYLDLRKRRISWWFDAILFFIYSILGCIAFYLTFFSLHPLVGGNYNILFYSPLMLIPFVLILFPRGRQWLLHSGFIISIYFYIALLVRIFCGQAWHWLLLISILHYLRIRLVWYREVFVLLSPSNSPHKGRTPCGVFLLLFALLAYSPLAQAQQPPRLTVVICVNGLNETALDNLRPFMPIGGLRTIDEEAHETTISFPQLVYGGAETLATLCTGTTPSTHGIAANKYFDRGDRNIQSIFTNHTVSGIGTNATLSPAALLSPTFTDDFRILHPTANSKIYSVGITPENTILLAGHAANACTWIDPQTLRWVTTSYYPLGLPTAADQMNVKGQLTNLTQNAWESTMDINMYIYPSDQERKKKGFSYNLQEVFTQSPLANKAVIELALAIQQSEALGKDPQADLLAIELNVISPQATSDLLRSAEQEAMYLDLNQDLGFLFEQLTKRIGKENFRVVLFGKPIHGQGINAFESANLTTNYFDIDRAAALINTYLMALYGHERWIDGGYLQSIYLNRTLIEQKRLSITSIQQQVSDFLLEFAGTQEAFPITHVPLLHGNEEKERLQATCNKQCFGDVVFTLQPLWLVGKSEDKRQDNIIESNPTSPLFLWTTERINIGTDKLSATEVKDIILK